MTFNHLLSILCILFLLQNATAQNVGVGQAAPAEKLDVDGALRIGQADSTLEGTIQYQAGQFRGKTPDQWSLFGVPGSSIVISETYTNQVLLDEGFSYVGETRIPAKTYTELPPHEYLADFWYPLYSRGNPELISSPFPGSNFLWVDSVLMVYSRGNPDAFYQYSPQTNLWDTTHVHLPISYNGLDGKLIRDGSDLVFITGNKNSSGFRFNIQSGALTFLPVMPVSYSQKRDFRTEVIQDKVVVYGGREDNVISNQGVILDLSTDTWTVMNNTNAPPPLYDYGSCSLLQEFVVFGGRTSPGQYINFQTAGKFYDILANVWTDLSTTNQPKGRIGHSMVALDQDRFMVFGGLINGPNTMKDTSDGMIFNIFSGWSSPFDLPGNGRTDHAASLDSSGNVMIYGGASGSFNGAVGIISNFAHNNGFILDPETGTIVSTINTCFLDSGERFNGEAIYNGSKLFITNGSCRQNSLGVYNVAIEIECNASLESLMYNFDGVGEPRPMFYRPQSTNQSWYLFRKN